MIGVHGTDFEVATDPSGEQVVGVLDGAIRATATRGNAAALARVELGMGEDFRYALFRPDGTVQLLELRPPLLDSVARVGARERGDARERKDAPEQSGARDRQRPAAATAGVAAGRAAPGDSDRRTAAQGEGDRLPDQGGVNLRAPDDRLPARGDVAPKGAGPGSPAGSNGAGAPPPGPGSGGGMLPSPRLGVLERGDTTLDSLFAQASPPS